METSCALALCGDALLLIGFLLLAAKSNMLRDRPDDPNAFLRSVPPRLSNLPVSQLPLRFSLARTQMAAWTVVIAGSFIYLFFCQHCEGTVINNTALALMGISVATTAAASLVDSSQIQNAALNPAAPPRHQNVVSKGFFIDILSDENGISIHRFQHVVWTIIAMSIYLSLVIQGNKGGSGCLPDLDPTLLVLQGISSAGYVGLKTRENQTASSAQSTIAAAAANNAASTVPVTPPAATPPPPPDPASTVNQ